MAALLLERDLEFAVLAELFADASGGRGGLVLVEGSPGVGKSALLERAASIANAHGLSVLRARGHELERAFGWGVARSLLETARAGGLPEERDELLAGPAAPARAVFELGEVLDVPLASQAAFTILHALYWLVVRLAEREPLLLLVDDAHWADEASLRFLMYLLGRLPDQPIAVLVAARAGERGVGGLLDQLAAEPAAQVRVLSPLGPAGVSEVVRGRLGDADEAFCRRCFELTAGNPLELHELLLAVEQQEGPVDAGVLIAAAEQAASSLGRSVLRRLAGLSNNAQALAYAVAVLEDDAPLHLAAALAAVAPAAAFTAADELARANVLRPGDPLGFTHPLLRAAVYAKLAPGERAHRHRLAARLLSEMGASAEQVSAHLLRSPPAGDVDVVCVLRGTAHRAMAQGVPRSAVGYLERVLQEPPPAHERAGVLAELGRAEAAAGRPEAGSHLGAAIELTQERRERAELLLQFGRVLHDSGRLADACASFRRGLEMAGPAGSELAVELEAGYLTSAMLEPKLAADAHRRVNAILADDRQSSRVERALTSKAMLMHLWAGGPRAEVLALARRLYGEGRLVEEDGADSQALIHVIGTLSWCDDYTAADGALRLAFAEASRRGSVSNFAMASQLRSRQRLWTGPIAGAVLDARTAVDVWRDARQMYVHAAGYCLVCGLLEQDEPDQAAEMLRLSDRPPAPEGFFAAWRQHAVGRVAACRGENTRALEAFLSVGRRHAELMVVNPTVLPWRSEAGLVAQRLGSYELARELVGEELTLAERFGAPRAIGVARRAVALLERGEASVERLRSATDVLAGCGAKIELARTMIDLGGAVRRVGRPGEARSTLRDALTLAEAAGATALARRAREELRLAGAKVREAASTRGDRLTASEQRVAELAAAGHSNRQIADALFVTVKSVEWHLGNVYRKLDIRGRQQLGALVGGPVDTA